MVGSSSVTLLPRWAFQPLAFVLLLSPLNLGTIPQASAASTPISLAAPAPRAAVTASSPLAIEWIDKTMSFLVQNLRDRARMVQFGFFAMLIALWIIWWRK